ncbi:alpha/beta hydrolase [Allokutzneria multivorans]|uniref:Alpha/beta hydrolase n=1 Tax=Allokutzneria multivorans TaxID=1142134 RepID=A0ABP7S1H1_9PSEU
MLLGHAAHPASEAFPVFVARGRPDWWITRKTKPERHPPRMTGVRTPDLTIMDADAEVETVVVVLHGGKVRSREPVLRRNLSYRRMIPIARSLHRAGRDHGAAVWLVRFRERGWNEPELPAVADARWAIAEARRNHPGAAIVLVGHSMGGRTALRVADESGVRAVCALAPWIEPGEPVGHLVRSGREVLVVHGTADRWTSPAQSASYVERLRSLGVRAVHVALPGAGHFMLRRIADWTAAARTFVMKITEEKRDA